MLSFGIEIYQNIFSYRKKDKQKYNLTICCRIDFYAMAQGNQLQTPMGPKSILFSI